MRNGMFGKLSLIMISIITCFIVFELIARIFIPLPSPYHLEDARLIYDKRGFWLNQPNQSQRFSNVVDFNNAEMRTDSSGLRYVPCRQQKNINNSRIYIIGDSQTFGWGVSDQDSWVNQLQCMMVEKNYAYNVINLGVPATNLDQYIERTKMIYKNLRKQDLVIYVITWNDFHSKQDINQKFKVPQSCVTKNIEQQELNYPVFCPAEKATFNGRKTNWRRGLFEATGILVPSFSSVSAFANSAVYSSVTANMIFPIMKGFFLQYRNSDTLQKIGHDTLESNNHLIRFANEIVRRKTDRVLFAFLPNRISYVSKLYDIYSKGGKVFQNQDFLWYFAKRSCENHVLNCFSLFPSLKINQTGVYEFAHDGHLNKMGSRKVALAVFEKILSRFPINK